VTGLTAWSVELAPSGTTPPPVTVAPAYINQLSEELLRAHPALAAARARVAAAQAATEAVRSWDDPMIRLGGMFADEEMRAQDGDLLYGVEQKLPLFGKAGSERRVKEAETAMELAASNAQFQQLRRDLAKALFTTALADHTVRVGEEDLTWLDLMVASVDARYRAGEVSQVWLLRLQNDRARRLDVLTTDRRQLDHDRFMLNRLLNRDPDATWPRLELPPLAQPVVYSERLVQLARTGEPRLKVFEHELQRGDAAIDAARRRRWPDFTLGALSRNFSGSGEWRQAELMLGFNLPQGNRAKYRAEVRREEARREAVDQERADYNLGLREEVHALTVKIDAARREALLYRDEILPRSELALASAQTAWTAGRGMLLDLLEARRMLLDARLVQVRALTEQYLMLSELVLCCGLADLEALEMIGAQPDPTETPR
jgi:cobalt-zinc-cadmium efflux system outer membrane protein